MADVAVGARLGEGDVEEEARGWRQDARSDEGVAVVIECGIGRVDAVAYPVVRIGQHGGGVDRGVIIVVDAARIEGDGVDIDEIVR